MMDFIRSHKILSAVAAVLVLGGVWVLLTGGGTPQDIALLGEADPYAGSTGSTGVVDKQLQETLEKVRSIELSTPLLSDPAFLSLQDIGQQIVSEPFGRDDPFAPISF